jgi:hypothetical protein
VLDRSTLPDVEHKEIRFPAHSPSFGHEFPFDRTMAAEEPALAVNRKEALQSRM